MRGDAPNYLIILIRGGGDEAELGAGDYRDFAFDLGKARGADLDGVGSGGETEFGRGIAHERAVDKNVGEFVVADDVEDADGAGEGRGELGGVEEGSGLGVDLGEPDGLGSAADGGSGGGDGQADWLGFGFFMRGAVAFGVDEVGSRAEGLDGKGFIDGAVGEFVAAEAALEAPFGDVKPGEGGGDGEAEENEEDERAGVGAGEERRVSGGVEAIGDGVKGQEQRGKKVKGSGHRR